MNKRSQTKKLSVQQFQAMLFWVTLLLFIAAATFYFIESNGPTFG